MNDHIKNIIEQSDKGLTMLENIMLYIYKHRDQVDVFDIAEIIREDKTFYEVLESECRRDRLMKKEPNIITNITQIFLEGNKINK